MDTATLIGALAAFLYRRGEDADQLGLQLGGIGLGLVFAIAASANFPVLLLSVTWRGLTTRGAVAGSLAGLLCALLLVVLGPGVWTATLQLGPAPFPYDNPALFSVPLAFLTSWLVSQRDRSLAGRAVRSAFVTQHVIAQTGFDRPAPAFH